MVQKGLHQKAAYLITANRKGTASPTLHREPAEC